MPNMLFPEDEQATNDALTTYVAGLPVAVAPAAPVQPANALFQAVAPVARAAASLYGIGQERYQTWPEKMLRSGVTLAGDTLSGAVQSVPGLRREDFTDIPSPTREEAGQKFFTPIAAQPGDVMVERAQDMAGLGAGGTLLVKPTAGAVSVGSGPMKQMGKTMTDNLKRADEQGFKIEAFKGDAKVYNPIDNPDQPYAGFFTDKSEVANRFAEGYGTSWGNEGAPQIYPVRIKMDNPLIIDAKGKPAADFQFGSKRNDFLKGFEGDYDGVILKNTKDEGTVYVPKKPEQIRSKFANFDENEVGNAGLLLSDNQAGTGIAAVAASERAPAFYSTLERAVTNAKQEKATADQWLGYLKNQPGVKPEEIDFTLANLPQGPITKAQLEKHIAENKVEFKEIVKGGTATTEEAFALAKEHGWKSWDEIDPTYQAKYLERATKEKGEIPTKYGKYQLPGGENYREVLMTLPVQTSPKAAEAFALNKRIQDGEFNSLDDAGRKAIRDKREQLLKDARLEERPNYKSSHWDEPNVLAHMRLNDRVIGSATPEMLADIGRRMAEAIGVSDVKNLGSGAPKAAVRKGAITEAEAAEYSRANKWLSGYEDKPGIGQKTLHIEEIQSDWHQAGRKQGYKQKLPENPTAQLNKVNEELNAIDTRHPYDPDIHPSFNDYLRSLSEKDRNDYNRLTTELSSLQDKLTSYKNAMMANDNTKIPDAPFKKTWDDLALKRALREAAEKDYDAISWTPGEAQAARYDLSKHVNLVSAAKHHDKYLVYIEGKDGQAVFRNQNGFSEHGQKAMTAEELEATIGKEAAKRVIDGVNNKKGNDWFDLKDDNLKVGGEGMKGFYDKMLVTKANAIAKKYGVKVEQKEIETGHGKPTDYADYADWEKAKKEGRKQTIWHMKLTPEMKADILGKGFPLFSSPVFVPVDGNPFERKPKLIPVDHDPFAE